VPVTYIEDHITNIGRKRLEKLTDIITKERRDAGIHAVLIGMKNLNMVGIGIERASDMFHIWEKAMKDYYFREDSIPDGLNAYMRVITGELRYRKELHSAIADLSDRKRDQIFRFVTQQRIEASALAVFIGLTRVIANDKRLKLSKAKIEDLRRRWMKDITEFYSDRELNEPRLYHWMEDEVGIVVTDINTIRIYHDSETGKAIKKARAEKQNEEWEKKRQSEHTGSSGGQAGDELRNVPGDSGRQENGSRPLQSRQSETRSAVRYQKVCALRQALRDKAHEPPSVLLGRMHLQVPESIPAEIRKEKVGG